MKKSYTKTGQSCRVTFELPAEVDARKVSLCGEFNNWNPEKHQLKRRKDGSYSITISLEPGNSFRYRYLINDNRWENDWAADSYTSNEFGTEDSVITV